MNEQDAYQSIPVAVARASVLASGDLEGIEGPEFSEDGERWTPYWFGRSEPPALGRVVITRRGQSPRVVVISWAEREASDGEDAAWSIERSEKPMSIFGAEVERHAYRVVFADVLAPLLGPPRTVEVQRYTQAEPEVITTWDPPRAWHAEVAAADAVKLKALYDEARAAEALLSVEGLQAAFTERQIEIATASKPQPKPAGPSPADMPKHKPETPRPQGQGNRRRRGKR